MFSLRTQRRWRPSLGPSAVLCGDSEASYDVSPNLFHVFGDDLGTLIMKGIEAAVPIGAIDDEASLLQQAQMARHCRTADWQFVRYLLNRTVAARQDFDDRPPVGIA